MDISFVNEWPQAENTVIYGTVPDLIPLGHSKSLGHFVYHHIQIGHHRLVAFLDMSQPFLK